MLYCDRFKAHLADDDPRNLYDTSAGCTWPTIPAYRYAMMSSDASGFLDFLTYEGVIFEYWPYVGSYISRQWYGPISPVPVSWAIAQKKLTENPHGHEWIITVQFAVCSNPTIWTVNRGYSPCNVDFPLERKTFDMPECTCSGDTGNNLKMFQVEWDEWTPPDPC